VVTGTRPGPVVWVDAAAHGDEYGGPRALQELVKSLDPAAMSGTLVAVFLANPPAFRGLQRVNPSLDDLADMGDAFPGRPRFATERIAAVLTENVKRVAGYFIDLHTGGDRFRQHPFVFYTLTPAIPDARYDELARGFGVPTLWRDSNRIFPNDAVTTFAAAGIPAFLLEGRRWTTRSTPPMCASRPAPSATSSGGWASSRTKPRRRRSRTFSSPATES
jgi:predicted deacylase